MFGHTLSERERPALLAGASGLVGGYVLRRLLAHPSYARVHVLVRQELPLSHPKLVQHIVDFENLQADLAAGVQDVFCCLGTTIRQAGSQQAFRHVDHDYPIALATLGKAAGAKQFLLVSALGADAHSRIFYNRTKGETERDILDIGLSRVLYMRPSLLLGDRSRPRLGETVGAMVGGLIGPLFIGSMRKYRPIAADDVAAAMLYAATHDIGSGAIESNEIAQLAVRENART